MRLAALFERRDEHLRHDPDVEEGHGQHDAVAVGPRVLLVEELVLGDQVAVRRHGAFRQSACPGCEVQLRGRVKAATVVVEADPVGLAVREECAPGLR